MSISEQAKTHLIGLIYEGETLDAFDLERFYSWVEASYEALVSDPLQQERFDVYCRSSNDFYSTRLFMGVSILKQALYKEAPEEYIPTYSQV
jgi:hypothetical protein